MIELIKNKIYYQKMKLLLIKGQNEGKIVPFDDEFYGKMKNIYFNCLPISMHIKYLRPILPPGKCYDRSLLMFFCFDNALLVRGNQKDLEIRFGKASSGHGWIEIDDYVYDPSLLLRFDRKLYYKMYEVSNVHKCSKEQYIQESNDFYNEVKSTTINDFLPGGKQRTNLIVTIPLIREISRLSNNNEFQKEVEEFLKIIQYDEEQISDEIDKKIFEILKKPNKKFS